MSMDTKDKWVSVPLLASEFYEVWIWRPAFAKENYLVSWELFCRLKRQTNSFIIANKTLEWWW